MPWEIEKYAFNLIRVHLEYNIYINQVLWQFPVPIGGVKYSCKTSQCKCQCEKYIAYQIAVTKIVLSYHFIVSLQYYAMFNNVVFTVNQAVIVFLYLQKLMIHRFVCFYGGTQHIVTSVQSQTGFCNKISNISFLDFCSQCSHKLTNLYRGSLTFATDN